MKYNNKNKDTIETLSLLRTKHSKPYKMKMKNQPNEIFKKIFIKNKINHNNNNFYKTKSIGCQTINYISFNRKFVNSRNNNNKLFKNKSIINDSSQASLSLTSTKDINQKFPNSKTYKRYIYPYKIFHNIIIDKAILQKTDFSDYTNKTQIAILPDGVKRNKYDNKDNMNFRVKKSKDFLYKMLHDFDLDVDYNKHNPILQGFNKNSFPVKKKYNGIHLKRIINHNNFILNKKDEIIIPHKRIYRNKSAFLRQIK
jgi:hypothetical protein